MIENINEIKKIIKPWGHEIWLASYYNDSKYALKEIFIKSSYSSSIQFHEKKEETNYIQSGEGFLLLSEKPIDIEKFKKNNYSNEEIQLIIKNLKEIKLEKGIVFHIKVGFVHRVISLTDLLMIEASTLELDDIFRLKDATNRSHGKILSEHE